MVNKDVVCIFGDEEENLVCEGFDVVGFEIL